MAETVRAAGQRGPEDVTPGSAGPGTHCPYCALQCAMTVRASEPATEAAGSSGGDRGGTTGRRGRAVTVEPLDFPVNRGRLCQKGWTAGSLLTAPGRLTAPLIRDRRGGPPVPAGWDEALDLVAERLRVLRARYGPDSVAVLGGGGLTNEKAYLLGKFARVALGTSQLDYNGRFCMSSAAAAGIRAFGADRGLPFPVTDLAAAGAVMLAGANPAETMPPLMAHLRDTALIVADPRATATAGLVRRSGGIHLEPTPGTDGALALGMLHIAVTEGLADRRYIASRTTGFQQAWRIAAHWWPERAERVTGVAAADMRAAVATLAGAARNVHAAATRDGPAPDGAGPVEAPPGGAYLLTGRGTEQHADGTDAVSAWINLALALGLPGTAGCGFGCITGQGNGQGGREHGQKADQLPGYRRIDDPAARAHVARIWGVDPAALPGPGRSASELLAAAGTPGGPRALLVFGTNPVVSAPAAATVTARLESLDLLVAADFVLSETAAMADVVLPVTQWAEEDGTITGLDGRVLRRRRALGPPRGARTDLEVLHALAIRLGQPPSRFPADPEAVFTELRAASAGGPADYSGITYQRLDAGEQLHWPCPARPGGDYPGSGARSAAQPGGGAAQTCGGSWPGGHPGTPRMFTRAFARPGGRAAFISVTYRGPAEAPDADYPLTATTGRVLAHYQSGAQTRRIPELLAAVPEGYLQVHPGTAARHGLTDGDLAQVTSRRGTTTARVRCDPGIRPDTVFVPFHFPGAQRANLITGTALDPVSKMPEFKVSAVRLEPAAAGPDRPAAGAPAQTAARTGVAAAAGSAAQQVDGAR